jgi:hypothetical protein
MGEFPKQLRKAWEARHKEDAEKAFQFAREHGEEAAAQGTAGKPSFFNIAEAPVATEKNEAVVSA